jgi:SAM-dependent methyltransferase
MKYKLIDGLRRTGVLRFANWVQYCLHRVNVFTANREFKRNNPEFRLPPLDLAFDAYNNVDWNFYRRVGKLHASVFADIMDRRTTAGDLSILEWGCGPGRLIRHMSELLDDRSLQLTGSDYNERTIDWCQKNLSGIHFLRNDLMPPLAVADDQFDVIYCFSVFTHLSEDAQKAWTAELRRVLKPGGLFVCSTHGDEYRHLLTSKDEVDAYEAGSVVVKGKYVEGKKWYLAIHPKKFVKDVLLSDFSEIAQIDVGEDKQLLQDVWVCIKPSG